LTATAQDRGDCGNLMEDDADAAAMLPTFQSFSFVSPAASLMPLCVLYQ
jgi:hypothetical protein